MIKIIRNWCEGIVVAIILSIIIELLVPEGNNKKYVKVVIGVYIIFVVINPILKLVNYEFKFDFVNNIKSQETSANSLNSEVKDIYIISMQEELKNKIEELGYSVKDLKIKVDKNYENIENIEMKINKKTDENMIEPVIIGDNKKEENYDEVIDYLKENYELEESQILIK